MSEIMVLRSGVLVSVSTSIKGNTKYYKTQLEYPHEVEGEERSAWNTTKVVLDPAEQKAASQVRAKSRSLIRSVSSETVHGFLCLESRVDELVVKIAEARQLADDFNAKAITTRVRVDIMCSRIAQDDVEAVKAISGELRDLLQDMQEGLAEMDAKKVRAAAAKAAGIGKMLSDDASATLRAAIKQARKAATKIVKAGEVVGGEIDRATIGNLQKARTAFLDLEGEVVVTAPQVFGRGVDFDANADIDDDTLAAGIVVRKPPARSALLFDLEEVRDAV